MDENFYKRCVVCFEDKDLLKCDRCVYHICKTCVVDLGKVELKVCREDKCRYDYLEDGEECHCYICTKDSPKVVFSCPTCTLQRNYDINVLNDAIEFRTRQKGIKRFSSSNDDFEGFKIVFFSVMDMDTGKCDLLSFRVGPNEVPRSTSLSI